LISSCFRGGMKLSRSFSLWPLYVSLKERVKQSLLVVPSILQLWSAADGYWIILLVQGWMVSLGIVSSKGVSGTKLATGDRTAGGQVLKSTDGGTEAKESDKDQIEAEREEARKVAAAALAAAKAAAGAASTEGKIEVRSLTLNAGFTNHNLKEIFL